MPDSGGGGGGGGGVMTPVSWLLRKSSVSFRIMISAMLCGTQFSALEILESEMLDLMYYPCFQVLCQMPGFGNVLNRYID